MGPMTPWYLMSGLGALPSQNDQGAMGKINQFLGTPLGGLATGGILGGAASMLGGDSDEEELKRREELRKRELAQQQGQFNAQHALALAQFFNGLTPRGGRY